jgi:hypothetical protein
MPYDFLLADGAYSPKYSISAACLAANASSRRSKLPRRISFPCTIIRARNLQHQNIKHCFDVVSLTVEKHYAECPRVEVEIEFRGNK